MSHIPLTEKNAIAQRTLDVVNSDGQTVATATVFIGQPVELSRYEWKCTYRIVGLGDDSTYGVLGFDAIQAIQFAFTIVHVNLASTEAGEQGRLRWCDQSDLGFGK
jgi:hypothetical protein